METSSEVHEDTRRGSDEELQTSNNSEDIHQSTQEQLAQEPSLDETSNKIHEGTRRGSDNCEDILQSSIAQELSLEDPSSEVHEDTRRGSDEKLQTSNTNEDLLPSTQEQLAELQLLTRTDLQSPASSFTSLPDDTTASLILDDGDAQLNEDGSSGRPRVGTGGLSSFTAILAASRKITTTSATSCDDLVSENGVPVAPLDQVYDPLTVEIPAAPRSPKASGNCLPTLNEGAEGEEDADDDDETPETVPKVTSTSFVAKLSSSDVGVIPVRQEEEQEPEELDSDDFEFAEMLEHLSRGKLDFLALTPDDLTARKLKRVHAALHKTSTSTPTMPYVRTLVSVDMLQLLLKRIGAPAVRDAVSRAVHQVNERGEATSGVEPIALLTSCNITSVVLEARQQVTAEASTVSPQLSRRTSPASSKHQVRQASHTSSKSSSSSTSSISSSPQCGTPRSPAADRRSILAKDGVHVLMQEKLAAYDHRGQVNALPAFRVRGASLTLTDSAAKRRQRGLQYANDHISHRTVHM